MTYRKWISVFLCVIFVCGLLAGCGNDKVQEEQNDNVSANTIPEDVVVHTDYGDLHYPDRWQEYVTIRQEQNGNTIAVTFETKSGEESSGRFHKTVQKPGTGGMSAEKNRSGWKAWGSREEAVGTGEEPERGVTKTDGGFT